MGAGALLWPQAVWACAVCYDPNEKSRAAFVGTTIFLSLLPLGMVFGLVYWLVRRARQFDEEDAGTVLSLPEVNRS